MINFTTTSSHNFWKNNIPELHSFFQDMEYLEYWTTNEKEIHAFLIYFEMQINDFKPLSNVISKDQQFNSLLEIFSYLKLGTFFYLIQEVNKEQPSFLISCLVSCKQENTTFKKLFIERFKLMDLYNFLPKIFNDNKIQLIRTIIND